MANEERINKIIDELTLFDDDLMSRVFDKNIEATEYVLQIILGRKITVVSVKGQENFKNPVTNGRNITLDVHAEEEDGQEIDIEVQGGAEGAHIRRARFHSSMTDARMLKKKQKFRDLKDSYVIFIYKHDKFGKGLPVYHINRHIEETGELFSDGSHIIYVNSQIKNETALGKLMYDFSCTDAKDMNYKILADRVRYFKEDAKGVETMCKSMEEMRNEASRSKAIQIARRMLDSGKLTYEEIAEFSDLTIEEVKTLDEKQPA